MLLGPGVGLGGMMKIAVLDIRTNHQGDRLIIGQFGLIRHAGSRSKVKLDRIGDIPSHADAHPQHDMLSLPGDHPVAPMGPRGVIKAELIQSIQVHFLGKSLKHHPGAASGEHDAPIFGVKRVEIGGQQRIIAIVQSAPIRSNPHHGPTAVGSQSQERQVVAIVA